MKCDICMYNKETHIKDIEIITNEIIPISVRLRESYIKKNYNDIYASTLEYTKDILDISFKERLWYYYTNTDKEHGCEICGDKTTFNKKFTDGYKRFCSSKCTQQNPETKAKRKKTTIEKYGVDNVAKNEEIKEKTISTNLERYGTKSSFQNKDVHNKWKKTIKEKYDVEHVFQLEDVKEKSKKTSLERYDTEHYVQTDDYKKKLHDNDHSSLMKTVYNDKTVKTNLERYGNEHYMASEEFRNMMVSDEMKLHLGNVQYKNRKERFDKLYTGYSLSDSKGSVVKYISLECGHESEILMDSFVRRFKKGHNCCIECLPLNSISRSYLEMELCNFLDTFDVDYITSERNVINMELDVYIPSLNIAFEMNGLYWHSELKKERLYHKKKTELCESNGIELIHIWEDDWIYKNDIVKSIIRNRLGLISDRIYARKCNIKEVNTKESRLFLDSNHIQGYSNSKVKLGLYYNDELVSLMTFGDRWINAKKETELIRFCNKIGFNVIGAASKLFKYYRSNYEFESIKSYADISMFNGNLYKKLGFEYIHRSAPNYFWVVDGIRRHRFTYNKKSLVKKGYDPNKSEREIMEELGYFRIWSVGQDLYVYHKQ